MNCPSALSHGAPVLGAPPAHLGVKHIQGALELLGFVKKEMGAELVASSFIDLGSEVGQDDHPDGQIVPLDMAKHIEAAPSGHAQVKDQDIRPVVVNGWNGGGHVLALTDPRIRLTSGDKFDQTLTDERRVIRDENVHRCLESPGSSLGRAGAEGNCRTCDFSVATFMTG